MTRTHNISLERLKEKISAVTTNVAIYTDHLERYKKEIKKNYGLTIDEAKDRLLEIEKLQRVLTKKERKLYKQATTILEEIEDNGS